MASATNHVHLEYYIYMPDQTGTLLRDALVERARAGVKVRLLLDAVGSSAVSDRFLQPLLDAGGEFAWFHPTRFRPFTRTWVNLRTHRKIVVVDGRVAFTGGINITDEENERLHPKPYRDLHLRLEGEVVRSVQVVFVEDWAYATGQQRKDFEGTELCTRRRRAWRAVFLAGRGLRPALWKHPRCTWRHHRQVLYAGHPVSWPVEAARRP